MHIHRIADPTAPELREGDGLSREALAAADTAVTIPMDHGVDSLNVAAAAAVALWSLRTAG